MLDHAQIRVVTMRGDCFTVAAITIENETERNGVAYVLNIADSNSDRTCEVSLFQEGNADSYAPTGTKYGDRIQTVLLNTIRRAFDSGSFRFNNAGSPRQEITLESWDFHPPPKRSDREVRSFLVHAAYWLSHRYGRRYAVRFDSEPDLDYLGVCVDDIARNLSVLEQSGMLISDQPGRGIPTDKLVRAYEDRLFREESERERVEEIFQEVERGIKVPVLPLYVTTNHKLGIARGSAIVLNRHEDIGMCAEAPFPVAVVYYEDNASGNPQLSRYIQRALAAADNMMRNRPQADRTTKKRHVNAEELVKIGLLDLEQKRVFVDDPVALAAWLGVELPPENELRL